MWPGGRIEDTRLPAQFLPGLFLVPQLLICPFLQVPSPASCSLQLVLDSLTVPRPGESPCDCLCPGLPLPLPGQMHTHPPCHVAISLESPGGGAFSAPLHLSHVPPLPAVLDCLLTGLIPGVQGLVGSCMYISRLASSLALSQLLVCVCWQLLSLSESVRNFISL